MKEFRGSNEEQQQNSLLLTSPSSSASSLSSASPPRQRQQQDSDHNTSSRNSSFQSPNFCENDEEEERLNFRPPTPGFHGGNDEDEFPPLPLSFAESMQRTQMEIGQLLESETEIKTEPKINFQNLQSQKENGNPETPETKVGCNDGSEDKVLNLQKEVPSGVKDISYGDSHIPSYQNELSATSKLDQFTIDGIGTATNEEFNWELNMNSNYRENPAFNSSKVDFLINQLQSFDINHSNLEESRFFRRPPANLSQIQDTCFFSEMPASSHFLGFRNEPMPGIEKFAVGNGRPVYPYKIPPPPPISQFHCTSYEFHQQLPPNANFAPPIYYHDLPPTLVFSQQQHLINYGEMSASNKQTAQTQTVFTRDATTQTETEILASDSEQELGTIVQIWRIPNYTFGSEEHHASRPIRPGLLQPTQQTFDLTYPILDSLASHNRSTLQLQPQNQHHHYQHDSRLINPNTQGVIAESGFGLPNVPSNLGILMEHNSVGPSSGHITGNGKEDNNILHQFLNNSEERGCSNANNHGQESDTVNNCGGSDNQTSTPGEDLNDLSQSHSVVKNETSETTLINGMKEDQVVELNTFLSALRMLETGVVGPNGESGPGPENRSVPVPSSSSLAPLFVSPARTQHFHFENPTPPRLRSTRKWHHHHPPTFGRLRRLQLFHQPSELESERFLKWRGQLQSKDTDTPLYSEKVFVGGILPKISKEDIYRGFGRFGVVDVSWCSFGGAEKIIHGCAYVTMADRHAVESLLHFSRPWISEVKYWKGQRTWHFDMPFDGRNVVVEVIPWDVGQSEYNFHKAKGYPNEKGSGYSIFVGNIHARFSAKDVGIFFSSLGFPDVKHIRIGTDKTEYPVGYAKITFGSFQSFLRAVRAQKLIVETPEFTRQLQIEPFIEGNPCNHCMTQNALVFCKNDDCCKYFCENCFNSTHVIDGLHINHQSDVVARERRWGK